MRELTEILREATKAVAVGYFHLQLDGGDPVYRERVYCYELYHQMRFRWPVESTFILNGEVDKAAHPILRRLGADHVKPDLLVHQPGYMSGNHAVIEVKPSNASSRGIKKDIETLSLFINTVGYKRAIYLIYGNDANEAKIQQIKQIAHELQGIAAIEIWVHQHANHSARYIETIGKD